MSGTSPVSSPITSSEAVKAFPKKSGIELASSPLITPTIAATLTDEMMSDRVASKSPRFSTMLAGGNDSDSGRRRGGSVAGRNACTVFDMASPALEKRKNTCMPIW